MKDKQSNDKNAHGAKASLLLNLRRGVFIASGVRILIATGFILVYTVGSLAQTVSDPTPITYKTPSSAAFTFLGASPTNILQPTTARAFGTDILNGIDSTGAVRQGLAFDFAPWSIIPGMQITQTQYRSCPTSFMLANTQVSLGTTKSSGTSPATNLAAGLNVTILNAADPLLSGDFIDSIKALRAKYFGGQQQPEAFKTAEPAYDSAYAKMRQVWLKNNWNRGGLSLAAALGWKLKGSRFDSSEYEGVGFWLTGSVPIGGWGQALFQLRYDHKNAVWDTLSLSQFSYGLRFLGGATTFDIYVEYFGNYNLKDVTGLNRYTNNIGCGTEFKVSDESWISLGFTYPFQKSFGSGELGFLTNFKWDITSGPTLIPE